MHYKIEHKRGAGDGDGGGGVLVACLCQVNTHPLLDSANRDREGVVGRDLSRCPGSPCPDSPQK